MEDDRSMDHVSHHMSMVPFAFRDEQKPVSFEATFVYHGVKYCYGFSVFLGEFLQKKAERYIDREQFFVINSADRARFTPNVQGEPGTENQALIEKNIDRIAKEAGIVMSLISVFHNDSVNKNGAQLIFNTHNVVYLNKSLRVFLQ